MDVACPNCGRLNRPGARFCASCQAPLAQSSGPLQPGQLLGGGSYRVERPLGKGGMGATWLVAQTKAFDRLAVLKEIVTYFDPADAGERQKALERFEAEARILADMKHPGIPDLYSYFSEGDHNYLVEEYIEGPDLAQGLTRTDTATGQTVAGAQLAPEQALSYAIQICEVLEYLASRQPPLVHNDVKPGNILIDSHSGRAVLVDFGTAKRRAPRAGQPPDELYGTMGYAAPELYQGRSEPRSDVYSLAATLYHLLTDDDPSDHPAQYPKLSTLPPPLADILGKALDPDLEKRPAAGQFRQQLQDYANPADLLPGKLELRTPILRLQAVRPGMPVWQAIEIVNRGQGYLRGEILVSQPWIRVGDGTFACAPGEVCRLPVDVETSGLVPGQRYIEGVTLMPAGGSLEVVSVEIAVALNAEVPPAASASVPAIRISPDRVQFGPVSRQSLSTARESFLVANVGPVAARCRIQGAPAWLIVKPEAFGLDSGARQVVEIVGRIDKVAGRRQEARLTIAVDGGQSQEVQVTIELRGAGLFG